MIIISDLVWGIYERMYLQPLTWCLTLRASLHYPRSTRWKLWTLSDTCSWFVAWCHEKNQKKTWPWISLVVEWIRVHLPGDTGSTPGPGSFHMSWATKPMCRNHQTCTLEPTSCNYWAPALQEATTIEVCKSEPVLCNKRSHCNEKPTPHSKQWHWFTTTRENLRATAKTQHSQDNKIKKRTTSVKPL